MKEFKVEMQYKMRHVIVVEARNKEEAAVKGDAIIDDIFKFAANKCDSLMSEYTLKSKTI